MAKHDIIVMGGSAGGIEACCEILREIPADLRASVFIVQHVGSRSVLAEVLRRCGAFEVAIACDGEEVAPGRAYVAPGDQHLLLEDGRVKLSRGPRENRRRPSVDVLFRSAARVHRSRVIAVVLSGTMNDGAAGVFAVKQRGGLVVVQDPLSAQFASMPENALRAAQADYCVPLAGIAALLVKLVHEGEAMPKNRKIRKAEKPPDESVSWTAAALKKFVHAGREYEIHWVKVDERYHAAVFEDGKQLTRNEGINIETDISPGETGLETFVAFIETEFKEGGLRTYLG